MGGGGRPYEIPDYKVYRVENAPELVKVRDALAFKGLKDPWLRNEVWKYDERIFLTRNQRLMRFFFRGWKYAVGGMIVTIAADKMGLLPPSVTGNAPGHH